MANEQNLKPVRSKSEARERGKKGGIASGEARREKRAMRELAQLYLDMPCKHGKLDEITAAEDVKGANVTLRDQIVLSMIDKARHGNIGAATWVRDLIGEKPIDQVQIDQNSDIEKAEAEIAEIIEKIKSERNKSAVNRH